MRTKKHRWLVIILAILIGIWIIGKVQLVTAAVAAPVNEPVKIRCTCYIDSGTMSTGKQTRPFVMAATSEWVGYTACVNAVNEDGSIGQFIGYYEILDIGYGAETGEGESQIFKGKSIGTIEAGRTVDVWMPTLHKAEEWVETYGDYVYIKLIPAKG